MANDFSEGPSGQYLTLTHISLRAGRNERHVNEFALEIIITANTTVLHVMHVFLTISALQIIQ